MRKIVLYALLFFTLSLVALAQNWLPLQVGNKWQYLSTSSFRQIFTPGRYSYSIDYLEILSDTIIANNKYFRGLFGNQWFRYDSTEQKIFLWCDTTEVLHMDFTVNDSTYCDLFSIPYLCVPICDVFIQSYSDTFANSIIFPKSIKWDEYNSLYDCNYSYDYADGLGLWHYGYGCLSHGGSFSSTSNKLIQCILNGYNIAEPDSPEILIQPVTVITDSLLNLTFQVKHKFSRIFPIGSQNTSLNFIDLVVFHSYYSKQDTILNPIVYPIWIEGSENYTMQYILNMNLLADEYNFNYKIEAIDKGLVPNSSFSPESGYYTAALDTVTHVLNENSIPNEFLLHQNYPNPFNPSTIIKYSIPNVISTKGRNLFVNLKVYDVLGNELVTLVNEEKSAGTYEVGFNTRSEKLSNIASGIYFYRLQVGGFVETKKMILLR